MSGAVIIFEFQGKRYEYAGGFPEAFLQEHQAQLSAFFLPDGFWRQAYPEWLDHAGADDQDEYPTVRWEIEHIGGTVVEVLGARPNGAIHHEDWREPRLY